MRPSTSTSEVADGSANAGWRGGNTGRIITLLAQLKDVVLPAEPRGSVVPYDQRAHSAGTIPAEFRPPPKWLVTAAAALSTTGRLSGLWMVGAAIGVMATDQPAQFILFSGLMQVEWIVTNGPVKALFRRARPDDSSVSHLFPRWLRRPRSTSFPSGHSSAAGFSFAIWAAWSPLAGLICGLFGLAMGASRVVLRAHHKTDVLAGWAWGAILGLCSLAALGGLLPG